MLLLILFAFLAGVVTVLSPCILPVLPIILSSGLGEKNTNRKRPLGVIFGFVLSFTLFTLFLSALVRLFGIPAEALRIFSIIVIAIFGLSFLVPRFHRALEKLLSFLTSFAPQRAAGNGFASGFILGLSLGLLWTPCVGPILASVIALAISGNVTLSAFFITFAYALGTAIPMFAIMKGGQKILTRVPWLVRNTGRIQQVFGALMILVAFSILTNFDRKFQTYIINKFPEYGVGLTQLEDRFFIQNELRKLTGAKGTPEPKIGKPMFELLPQKNTAPEIIPSGAWINSEPLTLQNLRGKVVLVDFWTYSCINCQRTFPYLRAWHTKYASSGLVIIGVHSPEFEFEKSEKNLREAVLDFNLEYPVVQDNDFATWRAYENRFWPAKYIIDKDGFIRYSHFGEGAYDETEKVIQDLLKETGAGNFSGNINNPTERNFARTRETYLGYARLENLANPEGAVPNETHTYSYSGNVPTDNFAFSGDWTIASEYAAPKKGASLTFNFSAKEVFLVMRAKEGSSQMRILVNGQRQHFGEDSPEGLIKIEKDRLYKIISLPEPGRHTLKLEFLDDSAELYAFTFG